MDIDTVDAQGTGAHGRKAADNMPALMEDAPVVVLEVLDSGTRDPKAVRDLLADLPETRECVLEEGQLYFFSCPEGEMLQGRLPLADGITLYRRNGTEVREGLTQRWEPTGEIAPLPDHLRELLVKAANLRAGLAAIADEECEAEDYELPQDLEGTDLWNGTQLADAIHADAKFSRGSWFWWDDSCFSRRIRRRGRLVDAETAVYQRARNVAIQLQHDATAALQKGNADRHKFLSRAARAASSSRGQDAMVKVASRDPRIATHPDAFDANPNLIAFPDATLDLSTMQFREHRRDDLITRCGPLAIPHDLKAYSPLLNAELRYRLPNRKDRRALQVFLGANMDGNNRHEVVGWITGPTCTGKSTLTGLIETSLGPYADTSSREVFLAQASSGNTEARLDYARLKGSRFVLIHEFGNARLAIDAMKQAASNKVRGRDHHKQAEVTKPTYTYIIDTNSIPRFDASDESGQAALRRFMIFQFNVRTDTDKVNVTIKERLLSEPAHLIAFLCWVLRGRRWYLANGSKLLVPDTLVAARERWGEANNSLMTFLEEECDVGDPTYKERAAVFNKAFERFCRDRRLEFLPPKPRWAALEKLGCKVISTSPRTFGGVRLKWPTQTEMEDAS